MESFTLARISTLTGRRHIREIPMSIDAYTQGFYAWKHGELIQNAFPTLSAADREFILSGITPEEWEDTFGSGELEEEAF
jgi:hypothetical protein